LNDVLDPHRDLEILELAPRIVCAVSARLWYLESRADSPHGIALDCVAILVPTCDSHTIPCLAKIRKAVSAYFELGLINRGVSVGRALHDAELGAVCGIGAVHVEW
jgi:hypothetical protein